VSGIKELRLNLDRNKIFRDLVFFLIAFDTLMFMLDVVFSWNELIPVGAAMRLFNFAREDSFQNSAKAMTTVTVGVMVFFIYLKERKIGWRNIAFFYLYLGIDDDCAMHERVASIFDRYSGKGTGQGITWLPTYTWQLIYMPFFIGMGFFIFYYCVREMKSNRYKIMVFSALAIWGFAEFLDFIEGIKDAYDKLAVFVHLSPEFVNHFMRVFEEYIEYLGSAIFLMAYAGHFMEIAPKVNIDFEAKAG
jgi:hypothetical protein